MPTRQALQSSPRKQEGMTIVQVMIVVGILGLVLYFAVQKAIDMRCADAPETPMCQERGRAG